MAICISLSAIISGNAIAAQEYRFSPVNQYDINLTAAYWNPIISYVSEKSGVKLILKIGRTSADTTSYVLAKEVDFAFTNHLFAPEREKLGWQTFGRRNIPPISGEIVVPQNSPITDISQLSEKDIAFPGPEALIAYKVPMAHLIEQKINVNVFFGGNQNGALAQLFSGQVQAVGGNSQLIESYSTRENKKFRILWKSEPYYDLALMASNKVTPADLKAVAAAFFGMKDDPIGKVILKQASAKIGLSENSFFIPSDGSEYANYKKFYQNLPPSLR
ncbi:phosphate/phosphite/phosphonate ABC transporter substrate-binding protein [Undibacterium sp. SXout11W]|uniref:phosphate/phosphite/phosphonate ABC transporter substrate-binding protein n=1 Tax=Undibacterium sp. SXout11W TaxID=3413050 RepID=UPI003BF13EC9